MTGSTLTIRHLSFTGPKKEPAALEFGPGLNVVYGASETGKSFILESIDFMLGSSKPLRDIPERVGYDRLLLGIEVGDGSLFTLERAAAGGQFRCFGGLHLESPDNVKAITLSAKHNPTNSDNVSMFLLEKIGLDGKKIRKNARGESISLSFRNLAHLCLISEGVIQKQESPIEGGQVINRTSELSTFKLLLTGTDDSAVEPEEAEKTRRLSRSAKIEVIDELIAEHKERLIGLVGEEDDEKELIEQIAKLNQSISRERDILNESEEAYRVVLQRRNKVRRDLENARERRFEIDELLERFALLDSHYRSDLERLEGIREAGALVSALDAQSCPLCGAAPGSQHLDSDCDGNVDAVVSAADAESAKIHRLREELKQTVDQLNDEARDFDRLAPKMGEQLELALEELSDLNPSLSAQRAAYTELMDRRSSVQNALHILASISQLEDHRAELEITREAPSPEEPPSSELSLSTLNTFSRIYEEILRSWNFPELEGVYFDGASRDMVISGKARGARGKGMRALTHAAFSVALLEFTRRHELPHPGFVVLDTPLLAYREPEGDEDDLTGTDVHERFYETLDGYKDRQVIVLENVDPPKNVRDSDQSTFFSKNPHKGRYGFFPPVQ
jgi:hypothetical protein